MPSQSLLHHHRVCNSPGASRSIDTSDKSYTSLHALQRQHWTDYLGLPCAQSRTQLTAFLIGLAVFKTCDTGMSPFEKGWRRITFATLSAAITFFSVSAFQDRC